MKPGAQASLLEHMAPMNCSRGERAYPFGLSESLFGAQTILLVGIALGPAKERRASPVKPIGASKRHRTEENAQGLRICWMPERASVWVILLRTPLPALLATSVKRPPMSMKCRIAMILENQERCFRPGMLYAASSKFPRAHKPEEISVFSQPWFVETAYGEERRAAKAFNKAGKLVCVFPYGQKNLVGLFSKVTSLDRRRRLSSFVFLDENISDEEKRDAVTDIIKQLPGSIAACCQFILDDESGVICDAFIKAGFECTKMPKYIRPPSTQNYEPVDAYALAKDSVMKTISKDAGARYKATLEKAKIESISASDFCRFYRSNLVGKGEQSYFPLGVAEVLIEDGIRRQKALTLAARDRYGVEAAAVFLFDSKTIYAWLATRNYHPQSKKFGDDERYKKFCMDILVIEAMIFAEMHGLIYDAEIIPVESDGVPRNPHRVFVNEKMLHLTKEESRFLLERRGWCYDWARLAFYRVRGLAKRAVDKLEQCSSAVMRRARVRRPPSHPQ